MEASLHSSLRRIEKAVSRKAQAKAQALTLGEELARSEAPPDAPVEPSATPRPRGSGRSTRQLVAAAQLELFKMEREGHIDVLPAVGVGNEFPIPICRFPIFPPISEEKQQELLEPRTNALVFQGPFGYGKRHGPKVTTRHEDVLIALLRLRNNHVRGLPRKLPIPIAFTRQELDGAEGRAGRPERVYVTLCTSTEIARELGWASTGSKNLNAIKACVQDLAGVSIEINYRTEDLHQRYLPDFTPGTTFNLLHVIWDAYGTPGLFQIQFNPLVTHWLEREFTYLNWNVRRKLVRATSKALFKFLSTQPYHYCRELEWLAKTIGWPGGSKRWRETFSEAAQELVDVGWLERFHISGTGRRTPFKLHTTRASDNPADTA
ncbi:hypothetical protein [Thioalkalivibrio thiocyanodenitrificans]|uniref:hypothetical protein n=1 Tax=Thioalkalivibrio thiocyanodenitrificans TaxID=243063 RepID=UPI0003A72E0F|nr:hypothetical protein [Thioalkalivibrio thiocyanodenitrificans]